MVTERPFDVRPSFSFWNRQVCMWHRRLGGEFV